MPTRIDPLLVQLAESVTSAQTLEQLTRPLLEMLEAVTGLESTYLTTIDLEKGVQHILYARNSSQLQIPEGLEVPWQDTLCRRALEHGPSSTSDVASVWGDSDAAAALGIATYVSSAVRTGHGELYGTLCAASQSGRPLGADVEKVLAMFSRMIGQHVERELLIAQLRASNEELASHAHTDALTGLPNRRSLIDELSRMLARAWREQGSISVAFIDLDGFKAINDEHGHEIGDRFLAAMAKRLSACLRAGDLIARMGGDEFVIVAPVPVGASQGLSRDRLTQRTRAVFDLGGLKLDYPGASVGVVMIEPGELGAEEVLKLADSAMYEVKRQRRLAAGRVTKL